MGSSSDGSFAWTDASDDTTDNETMAKSNKKASQSGDESESGKHFKKKLQQQLFSDDRNDVVSPPQRKRKLSKIQSNSDSEKVESPKKKRIKTEPESDVDVLKAKKKQKSSVTKKNATVDSYDEDYLDSKVKDEQNFVVPSAVKVKKRKSKNVSEVTDTSLNNGDVTESHDSSTFETQDKGFNAQIQYEDESSQIEEESSYLEEDDITIDKSRKKKKKSKKSRQKSESETSGKDQITIIDSFCAEETVIQPRDSVQNHQSNESTVEDDVESMPNGKITPQNRSRHTSTNKAGKSNARISERITFEDDDDFQSDLQNRTETTKSQTKESNNKLKNFVQSSLTLKPFVATLPNALVLSEDDDILFIRCPKNIDVGAFQDKKIPLENKCKLKLNDQTYEGCVADVNRKITIFTTMDDKPVIKNLSIKGYVRLCRRIPKSHIQDNIMVNNQCNFIPLPETKCRHPLFGLHYKKAMKLPSAVKERLQAAHEQNSNLKTKKKKKKDRRKSENHAEVFSLPKLEHTGDKRSEPSDFSQTMNTYKKKKKKNRKHSENPDETDPPRRKKSKLNPESVEAWESEKAIEETLFNF